MLNVHPTGQSEQITLKDLITVRGQNYILVQTVWLIVPVVKAAANFNNFIMGSLKYELRRFNSDIKVQPCARAPSDGSGLPSV